MYNIYKFDRGHNCLRHLVKTLKIKEMFIPYYLCEVIRHTLFEEGCKPLFYHVDDNFLPTQTFPQNSYILYPDYFGICADNISKLVHIYPKLIIDNAHAFYSEPQGLASFNSGIKFGYGENAYLWINNIKSDITQNTKIHYDLSKKQKCRNGFLEYNKTYSGINQLNIKITDNMYPFAYPLLAESTAQADKIVNTLTKDGLTIYRYWNTLPKSYNEYKFYSRLVPIPLT